MKTTIANAPRRSRRWARTAPLALVLAGLTGATFMTAPLATGQSPAMAATTAMSAPSAMAVAPSGFADLVEKVKPSVVSIQVKRKGGFRGASSDGRRMMPNFDNLPEGHPFREFFKRFERGIPGMPNHPGNRRFGRSLGSGFIVSEDGYVVTNNHVIENGDGVKVVLWDASEHDARLIGTDPKTDLALLKIKSKRTFKPVHFASKEARVGDWVVAVGNPFGLGGTVTTGIVSARGREIGSGPYDDFLQIDAAINRGNSGGPAFNLKGEVIGVNTAIFSPSGGNVGIGFAIPASIAEQVVADLKDDGRVTRGWLGVQIQVINEDLADSLGLDKPHGALVADIVAGSPASSSGLRRGDAIVAVNGAKVKNPRDLARKVARIEPGTGTTFTVVRNGRERDEKVRIGAVKADKHAAARSGSRSHDARSAKSARLGLRLRAGEDDNVVIAGVDPDGPAAGKAIRAGDVIVEVNGAPVSTPDEVVDAVAKAGRGDRKHVLLLLRSGESNRFVAVPMARG